MSNPDRNRRNCQTLTSVAVTDLLAGDSCELAILWLVVTVVERDLRSINETDQILVKRERWVDYKQGFDRMENVWL